jgi:phosphoglycolate phosphatase
MPSLAASLAVFDLDGTLIDSQLDLAHSVNATLEHLGLARLEHERIFSYVGNGAPVLIQRALGRHATEDNVERGLAFFLDYYREHMLDHTTLYEGVRESLERLRAAGVRLAILTNKPVRFSVMIVEGLGLGGWFERIYGGNSFPEKKPHPLGLETILAELGVPRERAVMVGDSAVDIRTARNARVPSAGVTYGFQPETFAAEPPDFLFGSMPDLAAAILSARS